MNAAPRLSLASANTPLYLHLELFAAIGEIRNRLYAKYEHALPDHRSLIRQAVSEAEALAWQTPFPHLFMPDLAELRITEVLAQSRPAWARAA